jgi:hypothetical protein
MSHKCSTVVINCIDFRFWQKLVAYLSDKGEKSFDFINMAGGAKNVLDEDTQAVIIKQLEICTDKHCAERLYLVNHMDCGAYGGSAAFGSPEAEREKMIQDLKKAADIVKKRFPSLEIVTLLHTFEGVETI